MSDVARRRPDSGTALLPGASELVSRLRDKVRGRPARDVALERVLAWLRTVVVDGDAFRLETREEQGVFHFPLPSYRSSRPIRLDGTLQGVTPRFILRALDERDGVAPAETGWRSVLRLRSLELLERDEPHGAFRPLRLGLTEAEARLLLSRAREAAHGVLAGDDKLATKGEESRPPTPSPLAKRLQQRSVVAVSAWTRGRLRGSMIGTPGPVLRGVSACAASACKDARFERLTASDLDETTFQVGLLHAPRVPLSRAEIETRDAYPDKAYLLHEGQRAGYYLPEIFHLRRLRTLKALAHDLAAEKAGLAGAGSAVLEVSEVTEAVESPDRARAIFLDGPVARPTGEACDARGLARLAGLAACTWLCAIQREDGALPLRVRPMTGGADGDDVTRMAMTARGLAAFGLATRATTAVEAARAVIAHLERTRAAWNAEPARAALTHAYLGQAAILLGDDPGVDRAVHATLHGNELGGARSPLVLANLAALLYAVSSRDPRAAQRCQTLEAELHDRFARALHAGASMSLAEWAEVAAAFPRDSRASSAVAGWLGRQQLPSGAFPDTTDTDFVYSRGTGKVFEALARHEGGYTAGLARALGWLRSMQYRDESVFFVPVEHRKRVLGGLRHDAFDPDAWIDAAGHLLLGAARWLSP